jgi:uncharacterized repeat protein (TIGR01451 family)
MKLSHLFNSLPKKLSAAVIVTLAVVLPVAASAAPAISEEGSLGVANVSAGDTKYGHSISASYNQVVKFQVYYHNRENPDSGKIAENLSVKINIPNAAGKVQTQTATIKADNSNTVTSQTTVNLDRSDAYLQYIPGSAVWRHNVGTNQNIKMVNTTISDDVVTSSQGLRLENEKPCYNFAATVTVEARVMIPGTSVTKQVELANQTGKWATSNTANPGDTLKYLITYKNTGNTTAKNVIVRDNLPPHLTYVPGSTVITNTNHPNGIKSQSDKVTTDGIIIGDYAPGSTAYVTLEAKIDPASQLACGETKFTNVGIAHPQTMPEYYNTAYTTVNKACASTPTYACTNFDVTKGDNRTVTISNFKFTASNGAKLDSVDVNWGDNSTPLTTNNVKGQHYQYAKNGTYTISLSNFKVNGKVVNVSGNCAQTVTFTAPGVPPTKPQQLVNTGAGDTIGIFAIVTVLGAFAHRLFLSRKLARD